MTTQTTSTGIVKFWNEAKGYGFVIPDGYFDEVFAHASQLVDRSGRLPKKGDRVSLVVDEGRDGRPFARRISIIGENDPR